MQKEYDTIEDAVLGVRGAPINENGVGATHTAVVEYEGGILRITRKSVVNRTNEYLLVIATGYNDEEPTLLDDVGQLLLSELGYEGDLSVEWKGSARPDTTIDILD